VKPSLFITSLQQHGCASLNNASKTEAFMTFYSICIVFRVTLKLITALQLSATGCTFSVWRLFKISLDEINLIWFFFGIIDRFQICKRRIFNTLSYTASNDTFYELERKKLQNVLVRISDPQAKFLNRVFPNNSTIDDSTTAMSD
jgi:uncharacterized protein YggT (Ycf19 family)